MASPQATTSASTLQDRVLALVQTLQFAWFAGHVTLLVCALRYAVSLLFFSYGSATAGFCYRTTFIAAAATYGIVVYKAFRARARAGKAQGSPLALAADENVQYLGMALVWLISRRVSLAVLPFLVYSIFHVATYTRSNLLPAIYGQTQPAGQGAKTQTSGLSDNIGRFVKEYYDSSMTLVAVLEIFLWARLFFSAITFTKGSWILFAVYTVFFRVRHSQSTFMQNAVTQLTARADGALANQSTPPAVRSIWEQVKGVVRQAADVTDVNRFAAQPGVQKKAQ